MLIKQGRMSPARNRLTFCEMVMRNGSATLFLLYINWDKEFKNGPSKIF